MNKNIKKLLLTLALPICFATGIHAQKLSGYVVTSANEPVAEAVISSPGCETVRSAADGSFTIEGVKDGNALTIWHDGHFQRTMYILDNTTTNLRIYMIETDRSRYNETTVTPYATNQADPAAASMQNINRKDFALGSLSIDNALKGEIPGLNVVNKSGMTGEGAYLQLRGIRTLMAENSPLIVINGVPYMPDANDTDG